MSKLFIALTMPGHHGYGPLPVLVNAALIRSVNPYRQRKLDEKGIPLNGGPETFELRGTIISTGDADEQNFPVVEEYGEVTGAIRDALS